MRRVLLASLFIAATMSFGIMGTAGADISPSVPLNPVLSGVPIYSNVILAYDFSDNSSPPSASAGANDLFNVIVDVFPENTGGEIRMVAVAPANSSANNLVCSFQPLQQGQAECGFNFTAPGVWAIHAQYIVYAKASVSSESITNLRVGN
jgi:hypothetical protein